MVQAEGKWHCPTHPGTGVRVASEAACDALRATPFQALQGQARLNSTEHQALASGHSIKEEKISVQLSCNNFLLFVLSSFSFQQHLALDSVPI